MALDRSLVGQSAGPTVHEVEKGAIRRFAEAIGDETPACLRGEVAPPTFPTTFRGPLPGLEIDPKRILHGGEEYRLLRPIRAGDVLMVTRRIEDVFEKTGSIGRMTFLVVLGEGRDAQGELVYQSRSTIIYR